MHYITLNTYLYCHREHIIADADLHIIFVPNPTYPFVHVSCMYKFKKNTHTQTAYHYSFIGQGRRFNPRACATIVYTFGYRA